MKSIHNKIRKSDNFQLSWKHVCFYRNNRKQYVASPNKVEEFYALGNFLDLLFAIYTKIDSKVLWEFTQGVK